MKTEESQAIREAITDREAALKHKMYSLSARGIANCVKVAKADPDFQISVAMLDTKGFELNTPSGIVDLTTGELKPHNRESWHTKLTGAGYDTDAQCPKWIAFLDNTFQGNQELIDYMQRLLGYAAVGKVTEHVLPFLHGSGDNGKTVLLDTVASVFGDYAISAPANFLLAGKNSEHPTEIARLQGARFVVCSEINQGSRFDESKVKLLTGGDTLSGRFMRQDFVDFRPTHTLFLMGNHQPEVGAGGHAFWRRLQLIPFEHQMPKEERNKNLTAELVDEEGPAILAWIVKGAVDVNESGLNPPESVLAATEEYAESEDTIKQFIDACCRRVTPEYKQASGIIWQAYDKWCKANGIPTPKPSNVFSRDLKTHGITVKRSHGKGYICGLMVLAEEDSMSEKAVASATSNDNFWS